MQKPKQMNAKSETYYENGIVISLTINGTEYENVEVRVTKPELPIREQTQRFIKVFELPTTNSEGQPLQYFFYQVLKFPEPLFEDIEGKEQSFLDYKISTGSHLFLDSLPRDDEGHAPQKTNEDGLPKHKKSKVRNVGDNLTVRLTIEGTEYEDVEVSFSKVDRTVQEQIDRIIDVFNLPRFFNDGTTPRHYILGILSEEEDEPAVICDEDVSQQTLLDYNIDSGDHLYLFEPLLYGPAF